jgi:hypothetical protein
VIAVTPVTVRGMAVMALVPDGVIAAVAGFGDGTRGPMAGVIVCG